MKKRRLTALLMAGVMAFGMMACGSSGEDKSSGKDAAKEEDAGEEKIPLKISHHPYLHGLPSIYAEENGLYDKFDYTIECMPADRCRMRRLLPVHGKLERQESEVLFWAVPLTI